MCFRAVVILPKEYCIYDAASIAPSWVILPHMMRGACAGVHVTAECDGVQRGAACVRNPRRDLARDVAEPHVCTAIAARSAARSSSGVGSSISKYTTSPVLALIAMPRLMLCPP